MKDGPVPDGGAGKGAFRFEDAGTWAKSEGAKKIQVAVTRTAAQRESISAVTINPE